MLLSIIIVNYNGKHFLIDCIESIRRNIDIPYEVIIVDNASSDDSQSFIRSNFPDIQLVCSNENLGFAKGNNLGAQHASGDLFLLLNNDTKILTALRPAIDYFISQPNIGILGCCLKNSDGSIQPSVGYYHSPFRLIFSWLIPKKLSWPTFVQRYEKRNKFYHETHDNVDWISAAFLLTSRKTWNTINGFDPDFFMYMEDIDFCQRGAMVNCPAAYFPGVHILHYEGGGKEWIGENAVLNSVDSYIIYTRKHYGTLAVAAVRVGLFLVFSIRSIAHLFTGISRTEQFGIHKSKVFLKAAVKLITTLFDND